MQNEKQAHQAVAAKEVFRFVNTFTNGSMLWRPNKNVKKKDEFTIILLHGQVFY